MRSCPGRPLDRNATLPILSCYFGGLLNGPFGQEMLHATEYARKMSPNKACRHAAPPPSEPDKTAILAGFRYGRSDGVTARRSTVQNTVQSHRNPLSNDHIGRCTDMVVFLFGRTLGRTLGRTSQIVYKNRKVSFGRTFGRTFYASYRIYSNTYHIINGVKSCVILCI